MSQFIKANWINEVVLYEVNIRQYTPEGTFAAFTQHLPRLQQIGVTCIWLMPITPISELKRQGSLGSYYACSNYTAINPEFGNETDFRNLIQLAHSLHIKVIIDWVANHTGCDNVWTTEHKDFYVLDNEGNFTERNGWKDVIDLNYNNEALQQAMIQAMKYWVTTFDIDGFRCDMAHLVPLQFWQKARAACDQPKPLFWLAECDEVDYTTVFDATYSWQFMHQSEKLVKGKATINDLYNVLHNYSSHYNNSLKLFFTSNHDENSWNGTEYEKYSNLAKAFAVFSFTWQGIPLIYSGQELPNLKRLLFFDKDCIEWTKPLALEKFYTTLSQLHTCTAIAQGETIILPSDNNIMAFMRKHNNQVVLVMLNLSNHDRVRYTANHESLVGNFINVFSNLNYQFSQTITFELMSGDYLVYKNF